MTETEEMNSCFNEMEKLKAKMEELREKRKVEEEKKLLRELTMEPNLKVIKTLLDHYSLVDENINKSANCQMKKELTNPITEMISYIIREEKKYRKPGRNINECGGGRHGRNKYRNVDLDELEAMLLSLEYDPYNVLKKKYSIVYRIHDSGVKPTPTNDEITKANIEATYNMFNIINKRLDDIESKLS